MEGEMRRRMLRIVAVGVLAATALGVLSIPVLAEISRLTAIPLGRGSATITWTTHTGRNPMTNSISGSARGLRISAKGVVPKSSILGGAPSGSVPPSVPTHLRIADIKGTIEGTSFSIDISITLPIVTNRGPHKSVTFGEIKGSFRGQAVRADLTQSSMTSMIGFSGTIGGDHVTGTIDAPVRHGNTSAAHANFDVTK
jgi:hypothetical protein